MLPVYFPCRFYVVLRGSLSALVDTANLQTTINESSARGYANQRQSHVHLQAPEKNEKTTTTKHTHSKEMWRLSSGDYFGEDALLIREKKVLHSVRCIENTELITISADYFDETLRSHFQEVVFNRAQVLAGVELFQSCSPHIICILALLFRENRYLFGEYMLKQSMPCSSLKVIVQGYVKISSDSLAGPPQELLEKIQPPKDYLREILMENVSQKKGKAEHTTTFNSGLHIDSQIPLTAFSLVPSASTHRGIRRKKRSHMRPNSLEIMRSVLHPPNPHGQNVNICTLGPGDLLCDIEAISRLKKHLFSAVCISSVVVYELKYSLIEAVLNEKLDRFTYHMIEQVTQRVEVWCCKHTGISFFNPLLEVLGQMKRKLENECTYRMTGRIKKRSSSPILESVRRTLDLPISADNCKDSHVPFIFPAIHSSSFEESSAAPIFLLRSDTTLSPCNTHPSNMGTDLTYHPQLHGVKSKTKVLSFDVPVPFGEISCVYRPMKISITSNSSPLSELSSEDQVPASLHSFSFRQDEIQRSSNLGIDKSANGVRNQNIKCTSDVLASVNRNSTLAQVRYQVLYNVKQSRKIKGLAQPKKYLDVSCNEVMPSLPSLVAVPGIAAHRLTAELKRGENSQGSDKSNQLGDPLIGAGTIGETIVMVARSSPHSSHTISTNNSREGKKEKAMQKKNMEKEMQGKDMEEREKSSCSQKRSYQYLLSDENSSGAGSIETALMELGT